MTPILKNGSYQFFLPTPDRERAFCCGMNKGYTTIALSLNFRFVACLCPNLHEAHELIKLMARYDRTNIVIVVGDHFKIPFRSGVFSVCACHRYAVRKKSVNTLVRRCRHLLTEWNRILTQGGGRYLALEFSDSEFRTTLKKVIFLKKLRTLALEENGTRCASLLFHYISFNYPFFLRKIFLPTLGRPKNLFFFFKRILAGKDVAFLDSVKDSTPTPVDKIRAFASQQTGLSLQKGNTLRIGSGGSVIVDFGMVICRMPLTDEASVFAERNYQMLEYAKRQKLSIVTPQPMFKREIDGQLVYCETKIPGISLDLNTEYFAGREHAIHSYCLDLLTSPTLKIDTISQENILHIVDEPFLLLMEYLTYDDQQIFKKSSNIIRKKILDENIQLVIVHGDFKLSNFIIHKKNGREQIGIIDWECASVPGIPLYDLIRFINHNIIGIYDDDINLIQKTWDIIVNKPKQPLISKYCDRMGLRDNILPTLGILCLVKQINDFYDRHTKKTSDWYQSMISSGLRPIISSYLQEQQ